MQAAGFESHPQRFARGQQVLLPGHLVQRGRAQLLGQGDHRIAPLRGAPGLQVRGAGAAGVAAARPGARHGVEQGPVHARVTA